MAPNNKDLLFRINNPKTEKIIVKSGENCKLVKVVLTDNNSQQFYIYEITNKAGSLLEITSGNRYKVLERFEYLDRATNLDLRHKLEDQGHSDRINNTVN
jgi:hypothetical protein